MHPSGPTEEKIHAFITTNFYVHDASTFGRDTSLLDTGIVDSTGVLEVISFLEAEFGVQVGDADVLPENLDTIACLAAFVARKQEGEPLRKAV